MGARKHNIGDNINGWKIAAGPEHIDGRVKYLFICPDCGHELGKRLTCNIQRLKTPCACKVGQRDPESTHKFIKEDEECISICHVGLTEYWHKLTKEKGMSQRKAANIIYEAISQKTDGNKQLEEEVTPEKIRNIGRVNTGKKKSLKNNSPSHIFQKSNRSPRELVETVRQARQTIDRAIRILETLAKNKQLKSDEPYRRMDVEITALSSLVSRYLQRD